MAGYMMNDWLSNLMKLEPPTNYPSALTNSYFKGAQQGYDKGIQKYQQRLADMEGNVLNKLEGSEGLSEAYRRIGQGETGDTFLNALIGRNAPQPNAIMPENPLSQPMLPFGYGAGNLPGKTNYLLSGQSSGVGEAGMDWGKIFDPQTLALISAEPLGRAVGGRYGGKMASAAANLGVAASQGGMNPAQDIMALYSLLRLIPGF
jgi:hypothetical protein